MPVDTQKLEKKLRAIDELVVKDDFKKFLKFIIDFTVALKKANADALQSAKIIFDSYLVRIKSETKTDLTEIKEMALSFLQKEMRSLMAEHKSRLTEIDNKMASVRDGLDADETRVAENASKMAITAILDRVVAKDDLPKEISKLSNLIVNTISDVLEIEDIKNLRKELDELKKLKGSFGGGGLRPAPTGVETPTGAINGANKAYVVVQVPQYITLQGQVMYADNGYTLTSTAGILTITLDDAPITNNILRSHY